jgi:hypothetical protein
LHAHKSYSTPSTEELLLSDFSRPAATTSVYRLLADRFDYSDLSSALFLDRNQVGAFSLLTSLDSTPALSRSKPNSQLFNMAPSAITQYNPSGGNSPFMALPEHVEGIIDVRTLADIHNFLSQSENDDDQHLAKWVGKEYLYEPLIDEGRQIRTTEGFAKLDKAYRRVRQLTGKAQDKWPFFDRNWKTMPSAVVKNLSIDESSPGVSNSDLNALDGDSRVLHAPTDQSSDNHHRKFPSTTLRKLTNVAKMRLRSQ